MKVDKRRVTAIRPTALVAVLKANQSKKPPMSTERFPEALYVAYRFVLTGDRDGQVLPLMTIYEAFTLMPGTAADYGLSDFARDVYLLDRSGLRETKRQVPFSLPAATGTKGSRSFSAVGPDGDVVAYYGIRFG